MEISTSRCIMKVEKFVGFGYIHEGSMFDIKELSIHLEMGSKEKKGNPFLLGATRGLCLKWDRSCDKREIKFYLKVV